MSIDPVVLAVAGIGLIILLALAYRIGAKGTKKKAPAQMQGRRATAPPELRVTRDDEKRISELHQELMVRVLHDKEKVKRLIEYERELKPNGSRVECMEAAKTRLDDDRW